MPVDNDDDNNHIAKANEVVLVHNTAKSSLKSVHSEPNDSSNRSEQSPFSNESR